MASAQQVESEANPCLRSRRTVCSTSSTSVPGDEPFAIRSAFRRAVIAGPTQHRIGPARLSSASRAARGDGPRLLRNIPAGAREELTGVDCHRSRTAARNRPLSVEHLYTHLARRFSNALVGRPDFSRGPWTTNVRSGCQMFRFIDVLPTLRSRESITRHLQEYFRRSLGHI